jgi:hypothetical protein
MTCSQNHKYRILISHLQQNLTIKHMVLDETFY